MTKRTNGNLGAAVTLLLLIYLTPCASYGQEASRGSDLGAWTVEHNIRLNAVKKVKPVYPRKALERGTVGVVEVLIGIDSQGAVKKVKSPPWADDLLTKAAAEAARRWEFGKHGLLPSGKYLVSRLSFHFFIEDGEGRAELFNPPQVSAESEKMRGASGSKDWEEWKEVPQTP